MAGTWFQYDWDSETIPDQRDMPWPHSIDRYIDIPVLPILMVVKLGTLQDIRLDKLDDRIASIGLRFGFNC